MKRAALLFAVAACVLLADLGSLAGLPEGRWTQPPTANDEAPADRSPVTPFSPSTAREAAAAKTPSVPGRSSRQDSTRRTVTAGETMIVTLPPTVGGVPVASYEMIRTPAMSDLAGRAFFWRTRPRDAGRHRLVFRALPSDSTAAADTLAMVVTVRAPN